MSVALIKGSLSLSLSCVLCRLPLELSDTRNCMLFNNDSSRHNIVIYKYASANAEKITLLVYVK